jgi:hypothetical protein
MKTRTPNEVDRQAEPEVPQHLYDALGAARERCATAEQHVSESHLVIERIAAFLAMRNGQRLALRTTQKRGARAAALAGELGKFVAGELERVRVEIGESGKDFAFSDFGDIELLTELHLGEQAKTAHLKLACAEACADVLQAQADVLGAYIEEHRSETVRQLLPVWSRDREAVRLDTSKDGVAHLSRFQSELIREARRLKSACQGARALVVLSEADVSFWGGHELAEWSGRLVELLRRDNASGRPDRVNA